ncbi:MAG: hypothetical protein EON47_02375 [Acetobacteraceae bacterium]|nr:MAG: hypothetical protein EON47_02375 [Acetobacteraceae bacterium]
MNHHHRKVLHALFSHPVSGNLDPRQVQSALEEIGATVAHGGHGQMLISLNGHTQGFPAQHHSLSKEEVGAIRRFLAGAGVDPARDWPL